jgi:hypothetical protein
MFCSFVDIILDSRRMKDLAFEHWLRTGRRLAPPPERTENKFNPYHDRLGRFTFAGGGVAPVGSSAALAPKRTAPPAGVRKPGIGQARTAAPRKPAAEIPGYPESGRTARRSSNDFAFEVAANHYNRRYGLKPGDADYKTPEFLKAWAMRESGGEGDRAAFSTDPFQVNKTGDWDSKKAFLGLHPGQKMTPAVSAYAALEWLRRKSFYRATSSSPTVRLNTERALARYNGRSDRSVQSGTIAHGVWYARTIMQMARAAEASKGSGH